MKRLGGGLGTLVTVAALVMQNGCFDAEQGDETISVHSDSQVKTYGGDVYVLEKLGKDNLIRITGSALDDNIKAGSRGVVSSTVAADYSGGSIATVSIPGWNSSQKVKDVDYQVSLGTNVNVFDMAFRSSSIAYVTQYQASDVLIVDPQTGSVDGTIDLSNYVAFAGTDSAEAFPFAAVLAFHGQYLYVALQRLRTVEMETYTSFAPADTSLILVIDANNEVIKAIPLEFKNPTALSICENNLYVTSSGSWMSSSDGGVEVIDMNSNTNTGVVAEESDFGGTISGFVVISASKAYMTVGKNNNDFTLFWTDLLEFDPTTGAVGQKVEGIENAFGGLAWDGTYLYVGDRGVTEPGIVVIDPSDNSKVGETIQVGMPPYSLAILERDSQ